jgi:hypothetical protein
MDFIPTTFIWECPVCKSKYTSYDDAIKCRNKHYPLQEDWWFCKCGYGIRLNNVSKKSIEVEIKSHMQNACK